MCPRTRDERRQALDEGHGPELRVTPPGAVIDAVPAEPVPGPAYRQRPTRPEGCEFQPGIHDDAGPVTMPAPQPRIAPPGPTVDAVPAPSAPGPKFRQRPVRPQGCEYDPGARSVASPALTMPEPELRVTPPGAVIDAAPAEPVPGPAYRQRPTRPEGCELGPDGPAAVAIQAAAVELLEYAATLNVESFPQADAVIADIARLIDSLEYGVSTYGLEQALDARALARQHLAQRQLTPTEREGAQVVFYVTSKMAQGIADVLGMEF